MFKQILTFSAAVLLCACATAPLKTSGGEAKTREQVNFFAAGHTQAAFKIVGTMDGTGLEGVLVAKKIGDEEYEVTVMTSGAYRLLHVMVTPQGVAYRYLFPDADTSLIRGRINQFLNLVLLDPGDYQRKYTKKDTLTLVYKGPNVTTRLSYKLAEEYPFAAKTSTLFNTADLFYLEYAPADAEGTTQVPHELVYKDGKIELALTLISLK